MFCTRVTERFLTHGVSYLSVIYVAVVSFPKRRGTCPLDPRSLKSRDFNRPYAGTHKFQHALIAVCECSCTSRHVQRR